MPFTHDGGPTDTSISPTPTDLDFPDPTDGHVVAVAVTVGVVGVFLFGLITWLLLRLRRKPADAAPPAQMRRILTSDCARPSTESKFNFIRKPLRVALQQDDGSWDFSDPDPKQSYITPVPKCQLSPLRTPPRSNRSSMHKGELSPVYPDLEAPPPAYCLDGNTWPLYTPPADHLPHSTA
ncbi:uncharacterized protein EDB91DRAFT_1153264 [Suillus paluster]|uniref:uncharacterized protein n=1 Tax=Suillus paluster TaxID=48578 RepID=UPI001B869A26|nr:uncharacterized protein EDB91DRAFT_1153264 [Suillus paluster]KAG1731830.1 hypothetical protein EDB91DRAFT_1153264 [Suillus paluster]